MCVFSFLLLYFYYKVNEMRDHDLWWLRAARALQGAVFPNHPGCEGAETASIQDNYKIIKAREGGGGEYVGSWWSWRLDCLKCKIIIMKILAD